MATRLRTPFRRGIHLPVVIWMVYSESEWITCVRSGRSATLRSAWYIAVILVLTCSLGRCV